MDTAQNLNSRPLTSNGWSKSLSSGPAGRLQGIALGAIEFVQMQDEHNLAAQIWERGVGPTLACGTGACACAVAAVLTGRGQSPLKNQLQINILHKIGHKFALVAASIKRGNAGTNGVAYRDKLYVDGCLVDNCPCQVLRELGADIVIAVDLDSLLAINLPL